MIKCPTDNLTGLEVVRRTIWGEARGLGAQGMQAVANVIVNRSKARQWCGLGGLRGVCLQDKQFSCWNAGDPNRTQCLLVTDSSGGNSFAEAASIAAQAIQDKLQDITGGAHYYFQNDIPRPAWAIGREPCKFIGNLIFFP